jgi:hypothetical protein
MQNDCPPLFILRGTNAVTNSGRRAAQRASSCAFGDIIDTFLWPLDVQVMKTPEDSFKSYTKAEEYYNNSLTFSIKSSGESSEDSIRMMCNLALVKNSMSKLPLPTSADNLLEAKMWYQNVRNPQHPTLKPKD